MRIAIVVLFLLGLLFFIVLDWIYISHPPFSQDICTSKKRKWIWPKRSILEILLPRSCRTNSNSRKLMRDIYLLIHYFLQFYSLGLPSGKFRNLKSLTDTSCLDF